MREYWANVYEGSEGTEGMAGAAHAGQPHGSREYAEFYGRRAFGALQPGLICRIHARLKPEGAPKRYLDDAQRWAWEDAARRGTTPRYI